MKPTDKLLEGVSFCTGLLTSDGRWMTSTRGLNGPEVFEDGDTPAESLGKAVAEVIVRKRAELQKQYLELGAKLAALNAEVSPGF